MKHTFDFVGLGFCSNDYLALLPEIPLDSKVKMLDHLIQGGGPAANSTVCAARLGLSAAFVSSIGDDDAGKRILSDFTAEHVGVGGMTVRPGQSSPIAYCWIDAPSGKRSVAWTRGTLQELSAAEVDLDLVARAKVLHLDGHNPVAALAAVKAAKQHGVLVSMDAGTMRDGVPELLPYADILIASEAFARAYTGHDNLDRALLALANIGAAVTGITMGEHGSMALQAGQIIRCPAFKVTPVDTTGAGDAYHAGFAVRYLETHDIADCMRFASAVSAIKCGQLGGRAGLPARHQVDQFLATNQGK